MTEHSVAETTTKHTPGPWVIEQAYDPRTGPHVYVNAEIESNGTSTPSGTFNVAEVSDDTYLGPHGTQEGNARLIAAAPDLLDACNDADARLTWLAEQMNSLTDNAKHWTSGQIATTAQELRIYIEAIQKRTRAAIAKAEGR